ncbi:MAG: ribonuclease HI family protein, partial [bacterium]|nr:ribonuclease HI family protein [bacterium]
VLQELGKVIGTATNNVAEYQALIYGLDLAINFQPDRLDIYSDSELLVKQMKGEYKTKNPRIKELREIILVKLQSIDDYTFTAIKREFNTDADALANKALDEAAPGKN